MSTEHKPMSKRVFFALAHPLQKRRFYLALFFSIILFPLVAIGLVAGTVFLIVPLIALFLWISARVLFAYLIGNSIQVSELNYPRIHQIAEDLKIRMDYHKPIYIFVYEQGDFNAYMRHIFLRRAIFLNSELLESGVSDDEVRWLIGRFIGYLRARRQAGFLGWVIRAAQHLVVFNFFLMPYERAMVYTGDRLAVAVIDGDISSAISAMQKLFVGRQLGYSVNPEGIVAQQRRIKGSFFAFLARVMRAFPHTTSRYVDLIVFAKAFFPAQYEKFEAANPGLPGDLHLLAASSRSGQVPRGGIEAGRAPYGWAMVAIMLLLIGGGVYAVRYKLTELALIADTMGVPVPDAVWRNLPEDDDLNDLAVNRLKLNDPSLERPQSSVPDLPPHLHFDAAGNAVPDEGCHWASDDPDDVEVECD